MFVPPDAQYYLQRARSHTALQGVPPPASGKGLLSDADRAALRMPALEWLEDPDRRPGNAEDPDIPSRPRLDPTDCGFSRRRRGGGVQAAYEIARRISRRSSLPPALGGHHGGFEMGSAALPRRNRRSAGDDARDAVRRWPNRPTASSRFNAADCRTIMARRRAGQKPK